MPALKSKSKSKSSKSKPPAKHDPVIRKVAGLPITASMLPALTALRKRAEEGEPMNLLAKELSLDAETVYEVVRTDHWATPQRVRKKVLAIDECNGTLERSTSDPVALWPDEIVAIGYMESVGNEVRIVTRDRIGNIVPNDVEATVLGRRPAMPVPIVKGPEVQLETKPVELPNEEVPDQEIEREAEPGMVGKGAGRSSGGFGERRKTSGGEDQWGRENMVVRTEGGEVRGCESKKSLDVKTNPAPQPDLHLPPVLRLDEQLTHRTEIAEIARKAIAQARMLGTVVITKPADLKALDDLYRRATNMDGEGAGKGGQMPAINIHLLSSRAIRRLVPAQPKALPVEAEVIEVEQ